MFSIHVLAFTLSSVASVQVCVCLKILRRKPIRSYPVVRDNACNASVTRKLTHQGFLQEYLPGEGEMMGGALIFPTFNIILLNGKNGKNPEGDIPGPSFCIYNNVHLSPCFPEALKEQCLLMSRLVV